MVTGTGRVDGRTVAVVAYDFTVVGGSNGVVGERKVQRCAELAADGGFPFVMLLEGGGHRIQEGLDAAHFAAGHRLFAQLASMSGWVPLVAAIMGPGFAGPSTFAALADLVLMVKDTSTMGVAGPALVKAGVGEAVDAQELGGWRHQTGVNGNAHLAVDDDAACLAAIRDYLAFLPSNAGEAPPRRPTADPADRPAPELDDLVPPDVRKPYDVHRVIEAVVDDGAHFELEPRRARNVVTTLARLDGRPVGLVANQARHLAGTLDVPACEKAAHFVSVCDAFGLPLVFLIDVPGLKVGTVAERSGLARRSGRLLFELGQATVPRLSVVLRKGYGLAYIAMNGGRSFDPELAVAWPTAQISAMSVEGAVEVAYRRQVEEAEDPDAARAGLVARFRDRLDAVHAARDFGLDDVIDPRDTRAVLVDALARCPTRRAAVHRRHHAISPI